MSDWKSRATPVNEGGDWRSRALPDPAQPGVAAIGSNASPAQAQQLDWVDKLKQYGDSWQKPIVTDLGKYGKTTLNPSPNIVSPETQNTIQKIMSLGGVFNAGDWADKLGLEPDKSYLNVPGTNGKKITARDIENVLGNMLGGKTVGKAAEGAGDNLFKAANKNLDLVAERYGKEGGVSPVLKKYGIHGSDETRQTSMDDLGDKLQRKNQEAEELATASGAKPNMKAAAQSPQEFVDGLRKQWTINGKMEPEQARIVDQFQGEIDNLKDKNAAPATEFEPEKPGPTVTQTRQMKSAAAAKADYENGITNSMRERFEKSKAFGLRKQAEIAIGKTLGPEAQADYTQTNDELGRVLTTKERALLDAEREARKNNLTEVKAGAAASGEHGLYATLGAYAAKMLNKYKSTIGYGLENAAPAISATVPSMSVNQNPWSQK